MKQLQNVQKTPVLCLDCNKKGSKKALWELIQEHNKLIDYKVFYKTL